MADALQKTAEAIPATVARRGRAGRRLVKILLVILVAYAAWCAMLFVAQDAMLFPRPRAPQRLWRPPFPNAEVIRIVVEGGQMEGWFIPAGGVAPDKPGPLAIYCHGNAELIDGQDWFVTNYLRLGCSVFLPEYRGYGRSPGKPSERAIIADCVRFFDELVRRPDVDASRIVIHGRSLGGGVAAQIAARRRPSALVLESTFTSVAAFARRYLVPAFLARHPFRTDRVLSELDVPVLVFHGTRDAVVPVEHGRRLAQLARNGVYVEYDCGHDDSPGPGNEADYWKHIEDLLIRAEVRRRPTTAAAN